MQLSAIGTVANAGDDIVDLTKALKQLGSADAAANTLKKFDNLSDNLKTDAMVGAFKDMDASAVKSLLNITDSVDDVTDSMENMTGAAGGLGKIKTGFQGIWSVMKANPVVSVTAGIAAASAGIYALYRNYKNNLVDTATEATSAWDKTSTDLNSKMEQVQTLKLRLDTEDLSASESMEIRSQILAIQSEITASYGEQASGIDLVNGSLETQLNLLQNIQSKEAESNVNKNQKAYEDAQYEMAEKQRGYGLGEVSGAFDKYTLDPTNELGQEIASIAKENGLKINGQYSYDGVPVGVNVVFTGNADEAEGVIDNFMTDIKGLQDEYGDDNPVLKNLISGSGGALAENQKILDEYQENYQSFLEQSMYAEGFETGKPADVFSKYTDAVNEYNEALASGEPDAINKARTAFNGVKESVDATLKASPQYKSLFDSVGEQLDEGSQKLYDFQEAADGNSVKDNMFSSSAKDIKSFSKELKDLNLDKVDVANALLTEGDDQPGESAITKLAEAWGLDLSEALTTDEANAFADTLANIGVVSGGTAEAIDEVTDSAEAFKTTISSAMESQANINSALQNSISPTGLTGEDVDNLGSAFTSVDGYNTPELLEKTASGLRINRDALAAYQAEQEKVTKNKFVEAIEEQNNALADSYKVLKEARLTGDDGEINAAKNAYEASKGELENLKLLQSQYQGLTSDYAKWMSALSDGEAGDVYDNVATSYQNLKETMKDGWIGTDEAKRGTDYFWDGELDNASAKEVESTYNTLKPLLDRWYATDGDGNLDANTSLSNFLDDAERIPDVLGKDAQTAVEDLGNGMKKITLNADEFGEAFGVSEEVVQDFGDKLSDKGYDVEVVGVTAGLDEVVSEAETASNKIKQITGDTYEWDFEPPSLKKAQEQVEKAKELASDAKYHNEDGSFNYDAPSAKEAEQVYEGAIRAEQEASKPAIMSIDASSAIDSAQEGVQALQDFQKAKDELDVQTQMSDMGMDNSLDSAQEKATEQLENLQQLQSEGKLPLEVDTTGIQEAEDSISNVESEELQVKVGADTSELDSATSGIENEEVEVPVTVKIDEGQFSTLYEGITGETLPVEVDPQVNTDGTIGDIQVDATANVTGVEGETAEPIEVPATATLMDTIGGETETAEATGKINWDTTTPPTIPPVTTTGTINWDDSEPPSPGNVTATGTVTWSNANSPAPPMGLVATGTINWVNGSVAPPPAPSTVTYDMDAPDAPSYPNINRSVNYSLNAPPAPSYPNISRSVTYTINTVGSPPAFAGTAHATGTAITMNTSRRALANGSLEEDALHQSIMNSHPEWKTKQDQMALTGELGRELVVTNGKWYTVGTNGAEFSSIPAGSIVFNHKQTEQLLSKGSTTGRGKTKGSLNIPERIAHAKGTLTGKAFASGSTDDSKSDSSKSKEKEPEKVDWIERLFERLEKRIDRYEAKAENSKSVAGTRRWFNKALSTVTKSITSNNKAIKRYQAEANSVKLSDDLKSKVRNGTIDITKLSEDQKKLVDEYQEWYDKIEDCKDAIVELKAKQKELAQEKLDNIMDKYEASQGRFTSKVDIDDAKLSYYEANGDTLTGNKNYRNTLNDKGVNIQKTINSLKRERSAYQKEMKKAKKTFGENSPEYREAIAAYNGITEEIWKQKEAYVENQKAIRQITYTLTDNAINALQQFVARLKSMVELKEARNLSVTKGDYQSQIGANNQLMDKKRERLTQIAYEATFYSVQSKEYQELLNEYEDVRQSIIDAAIENEAFADSIRDLDWKPFHDGIDVLNRMTDDYDHMLDLMDEEAYVSIGGDLTEDGAAAILLMGNAIEANQQKIANYTASMKRLDEEVRNGRITQDEYNEQMNDTLDSIQSAVQANEQYKDSIVDVYKAQIEADNDVLQENIDKRQEALKKMKDYYSWQKNIRNQNKDINSLKAQIAALSGVDTPLLFNCWKLLRVSQATT